MYPYVLCVIDMQNEFPAARDSATIRNCEQEVCRAVKDNAYIIFARYISCGKTNPVLTRLVDRRKYPHYTHVCAKLNDKSVSILKAMYRNNIVTHKVCVCGVNTDVCVYSTVKGLYSHFENANSCDVETEIHNQWKQDQQSTEGNKSSMTTTRGIRKKREITLLLHACNTIYPYYLEGALEHMNKIVTIVGLK